MLLYLMVGMESKHIYESQSTNLAIFFVFLCQAMVNGLKCQQFFKWILFFYAIIDEDSRHGWYHCHNICAKRRDDKRLLK